MKKNDDMIIKAEMLEKVSGGCVYPNLYPNLEVEKELSAALADAEKSQQPDWMAKENVQFLPEDRLLKFRGSDF